MFALDRTSRTLLATSAFAAFTGAFVSAPFVARGAADDHVVRTAPATPAATAGAFALVLPRRDPFAGDPPATHPSSPPMAPIEAMPPISDIPAAIRPLPANAGASGFALPFTPPSSTSITSSPPRITAVVTGAHPFALVDEGETTRVVTVGDRIQGVTIVGITIGGIRLSDGTRLSIEAAPFTGLPSPTFPVPSSSPVAPPSPLPYSAAPSPIPKGHQP